MLKYYCYSVVLFFHVEKLSNGLYHDFQYTISNERLGYYFIITHKYIESLFSAIIFKIIENKLK